MCKWRYKYDTNTNTNMIQIEIQIQIQYVSNWSITTSLSIPTITLFIILDTNTTLIHIKNHKKIIITEDKIKVKQIGFVQTGLGWCGRQSVRKFYGPKQFHFSYEKAILKFTKYEWGTISHRGMNFKWLPASWEDWT